MNFFCEIYNNHGHDFLLKNFKLQQQKCLFIKEIFRFENIIKNEENIMDESVTFQIKVEKNEILLITLHLIFRVTHVLKMKL